MRLNFDNFLARPEFAQWRDAFEQALQTRTSHKRHGDLQKWLDILAELPDLTPSLTELNNSAIRVGKLDDLTQAENEQLIKCLKDLRPWRKGPFQIFDNHIDTEWRSDWKWQRLLPYISPLEGKRVLDVGCGNGYHCWRMLGAGAEYVLGIDPSILFHAQFKALQSYINKPNIDMLPIGIEDMPTDMPLFDTVFSMGVLYHRRNPINHLIELKQLLNDKGELVLETLIFDEFDECGESNEAKYEEIKDGVLTPKDRYAQMRNAWSILSVTKIIDLLAEAGFRDIKCVDQNTTTMDEQRATDWMDWLTLSDFLDSEDQSKTIEGYPRPKRAIFVVQK